MKKVMEEVVEEVSEEDITALINVHVFVQGLLNARKAMREACKQNDLRGYLAAEKLVRENTAEVLDGAQKAVGAILRAYTLMDRTWIRTAIKAARNRRRKEKTVGSSQ